MTVHNVGGHRPPLQLKHVFQRKLHDSGTARRWPRTGSTARSARTCCAAKDPAKRIRIRERYARIARTETVRYVKSFSSNFNALLLLNLELPRHGLVPLPIRRSNDAVIADVSVGALRRYCIGRGG